MAARVSRPCAPHGSEAWAVVHLVDVIARQDQNRVSPAFTDVVQVLQDGIRCPAVPLLMLSRLVWLQQTNAPRLRSRSKAAQCRCGH